MSSYALATLSSEPHIIGPVYPQLREFSPNFLAQKGMYIALAETSKITDCISCGSFRGLKSMIVSKKFISLLKEFQTCDFSYEMIQILFQGEFFEYYHLTWSSSYMGNEISTLVDFEKSIYNITDLLGKKHHRFNAKSLDQLYSARKELIDSGNYSQMISAEKVFFSEKMPRLDIIVTKFFDNSVYFSRRICKKLEEFKTLGLDLMPTQRIDFIAPATAPS